VGVADGRGAVGGQPARGGRAATFSFFNPFQKSLPRAIYASRHICAERIWWALGTELFAGPVVPSALCRELPLGRGCAERIVACAESNSLSAKPWIPVVPLELLRFINA
jgi:hypothetical protein